MFKHSLAFALAFVSSVAFAGQQYVDESGFAVSGYDVVAYFSLDQNSIGQRQPEAIPGKKSITAEYNGATWAFSTEANRDLFIANPTKFAPQFDGHCAFGVSQGGKVPANPNLWRIVDDKLYVNINPAVVGFFEDDIPGHIVQADQNWMASLEQAEASNRSWKAIRANDGTYSTDAPL